MSISGSMKGDWLQIKGTIKQKWGKLTDDELTEISGSKDKLLGKLISKYNMTKEDAQAQINKIWP